MRTLLAILTLVPFLTGAAMPGCTEAGADVPAALAAAQASPARCLYIPTGVYSVTQAGGQWLNVTADNLDIYGDGIGRTIISTQGVTLTNTLSVLMLRGARQHVHDLTIQIGAGYSGSFGVIGVQAYTESSYPTIDRIEIVGGYSGDGGANGAGISLYRTWQTNGGAQNATIEDTHIHDTNSQGIVINSNGNTIRHNTIERISGTGLTHGMYVQGGNNLIDGNTVVSVSGWAFHQHAQVPNIDASGNRYSNNLSIDPGSGHYVINSTTNAANPALPLGAALDRFATVTGNVLRNTSGRRSAGIWCNGVPCLVEANTLEDVYVTTGGGWIEDNAGSVITGNSLMTLNAPNGATNYAMINVRGPAGAIVSNNRLSNGQAGAGIRATGGRHLVSGNSILMSGNGQAGLILDGDSTLVTGNRVESTGSAYVLALGPSTNIVITGNVFKRTGDLWNINLTGITGQIANNIYDGTPRWNGSGAGVLR